MDRQRTQSNSGNRDSRDLAILDALACRVRMLSLDQVAVTWWPPSKHRFNYARRRLTHLIDHGLLDRYEVDIEPIDMLEGPAAVWSPGQPRPSHDHFVQLANHLQGRWNQPPQRLLVYVASKRAANLFGSYGGGLKDPLQATHDLHLGAVYLHFLKHTPELAASWRGEDLFGKAGFGIKDPDAFLVDKHGDITKAIEFGGKYDVRRVKDFHEHCAEHNLPYEMW